MNNFIGIFFGDLPPGLALIFPIWGIVLLALTRIFRRPLWFMIAANTFIWISLYWMIRTWSWPVMQGIKVDWSETPVGDFSFIPIPIFAVFLRQLIEVLLSFLFGLYCVRRRFHIMKFMAGCYGASWLLVGLFYGIEDYNLPNIFVPALNMLLCTAIIALPLQRHAIERLVGFPLRAVKDVPTTEPQRIASNVIGHVTIAVLIALSLGAVVMGYYERKMVRWLQEGPKPAYQSPALHNAYVDLRERFSRTNEIIESPILSIVTKENWDETPGEGMNENNSKFYVFSESPVEIAVFSSITPPDMVDVALATFEPDNTELIFEKAGDYINDFETASTADYCFYNEPDALALPHFINLRTVARLLAFRSNSRMKEGRLKEALDDIKTIMNVGWLLTDDAGSLIVYMVGVAINGIGLNTAENYYLRFRYDRDALEKLRIMLENQAPRIRQTYNALKLRRNEPGYWPIVPYFEVAVPSMGRSVEHYYAKWTQLDYLLLAIALEEYRLNEGAYPENLEALVPDYIERLPLDPLDGGEYVLNLADGDFILSCPAAEKRTDNKRRYLPNKWTFSPSNVDNDDLRETLQSLEIQE